MKIRLVLKSLGLLAFVFVTQAHATYPDQEQYQEIYEGLRKSDQPWAKKFMEIYDQINLGHKEDLNDLAQKITISARGQDVEDVRKRLLKRLTADKILSIQLKELIIKAGKKSADNWILFTSLNKMIGVDGNTGIYDDAIAWINKDKTIHYNFNKVEHVGNQIAVAKTIGLHTLLTVRNLKTLSGDKAADIKACFKIYSPNMMFDDLPEALKIAKKISLSDVMPDGKVTLWKPSVSYEFDGKNPKYLIWDCASILADLSSCSWYFETIDQEVGWRRQMGDTDIKGVKDTLTEAQWSEFNTKFQAIRPDEELRPMDIIVWRKRKLADNTSGSGHTGLFVGKDPANIENILLAELNRFDDKSYEGIGILSVPLFRKNEDEGFVWYTYVLRQR